MQNQSYPRSQPHPLDSDTEKSITEKMLDLVKMPFLGNSLPEFFPAYEGSRKAGFTAKELARRKKKIKAEKASRRINRKRAQAKRKFSHGRKK